MKNLAEKIKLRIFLSISIFIVFFCLNLSGDTFFKISGKVVHNGSGVEGIKLRIYKLDSGNDTITDYALSKSSVSDRNGNFYFYVKSGIYKITYGRRAKKGYVANSYNKTIQVKEKNISNIIFFLSKECKISGTVKFEDNTPIKRGSVQYRNNEGLWIGRINSNGEYTISGIKEGENGYLNFTPDGFPQKDIYDVVLNKEGTELKNMNLVLPKKKSISGKVIDKTDGNIIQEFAIVLYNVSNEEQIRFDSHYNSGEFVFYNLEKGKYMLFCDAVAIISDEGDILFKPKDVEINLQDGETKEIVVELERK